MSINYFLEKFKLTIDDLHEGIFAKHVWVLLAWQDTKVKYRRSILGPFWVTLSSAIFIAALGPIYGTLMGNESTLSYIFFLAIGYIFWQFISSLILDGCQTFIGSEGLIRQTNLPLSTYPMTVLWKNIIVFLHNLLIILILAFFCISTFSISLISLPIGFGVLCLNGFCWAIIFGVISARYRDIPQIITSLLQLLFVLTPVFWYPGALKHKAWAYELNPFYHFLAIMRTPLMDGVIPIDSWFWILSMTVVDVLVASLLFIRWRSNIVYWL